MLIIKKYVNNWKFLSNEVNIIFKKKYFILHYKTVQSAGALSTTCCSLHQTVRLPEVRNLGKDEQSYAVENGYK